MRHPVRIATGLTAYALLIVALQTWGQAGADRAWAVVSAVVTRAASTVAHAATGVVGGLFGMGGSGPGMVALAGAVVTAAALAGLLALVVAPAIREHAPWPPPEEPAKIIPLVSRQARPSVSRKAA